MGQKTHGSAGDGEHEPGAALIHPGEWYPI